MCSFLHSFQAKYISAQHSLGRDADTAAARGAELPSSGWKDNTVNTWAALGSTVDYLGLNQLSRVYRRDEAGGSATKEMPKSPVWQL